MLFMKGNKMFPQCGFSNTAVTILKSIVPADNFETFDVLSDEEVSNPPHLGIDTASYPR